MKFTNRVWGIFIVFVVLISQVPVHAQSTEEKLNQLEDQISVLMDEIEALRTAPAPSTETGASGFLSRTTIGGYGEVHYNDTVGSDKSLFDVHRFVLYLGHRFSDRVVLHSETEIEHAYIEDGSGGYVAVEQLFLDIAFTERFNMRFGRLLIPVGIVNPYHEPTLFNGVERPNVDKYIVPSTWYGDGIGIYGAINPSLNYQFNITSGLDGSGFSALNGIRGGRQKERPGFNDASFSGRLEYTRLGGSAIHPTQFNAAISFFHGGVNNANKGSVPGTDTNVTVLALDTRYSIAAFDFRGQYVTVSIDDPSVIGEEIAEGLNGWYLEAAWHAIQNATESSMCRDLIFFARYEDYNTQDTMPTGLTADPRAHRKELTFGISWFPVSNVVLKADYQVMDDDTEDGRNNQINLGVGWRF